MWRPEGVDTPARVAWGFTDRHGGVASVPRDSLTIGPAPGVSSTAVVENARRAIASLNARLRVEDVAMVQQVHGDDVVFVDQPAGPTRWSARADGLWTTRPGVVLAVRVADCVPVLLAGPGGVAAVHAGWRGVAAGIVPKAVRILADGLGVRPAAIAAAVGPCIGQDAFEVGPEVVEGLRARVPGVARFVKPGRADRQHVDLRGCVHAQLLEAGVVRQGDVPACTTDARWFSYRGDGPDTGRQAGWITWLG